MNDLHKITSCAIFYEFYNINQSATSQSKTEHVTSQICADIRYEKGVLQEDMSNKFV